MIDCSLHNSSSRINYYLLIAYQLFEDEFLRQDHRRHIHLFIFHINKYVPVHIREEGSVLCLVLYVKKVGRSYG